MFIVHIIDCLLAFQGSVRFSVTVPSMPDKPEFTLKGQTLNFSLPLTDNVSITVDRYICRLFMLRYRKIRGAYCFTVVRLSVRLHKLDVKT